MGKVFINLFIGLAFVMPTIAYAEPTKKASRWDGTYLLVGGGGTVSARKIQVLNSTGGYDRQKLKSRTVLRAEMGKEFLGDFRMGFEFNYFPKNRITIAEIGTNAGREINGKITTKAGFLNFYYDMKEVDRTALPYIGFGVGLSRNNLLELKRNWTTISGTPGNGSDVFEKKFINKFSWKMVLGLKLQITEMIFVDLNYNYANFGRLRAVLDYNSFNAGGVQQNTTKQSASVFQRAHLREHVGIANIGFKF